MTTDKDRGADKPVKKPGVLSRLYSGETTVDFIKRRLLWYGISLVLMLVSLSGLGLAIGSNHMNWGIEFVGGTQFQGAVKEGVSLTEVEAAVEADGVEVVTAQTAGTGDDATVVVRTESLPNKEQQEIQEAMSAALGGEEVSISNVSESWGASVSTKAYWALGVSLALIMGYLWWRYERKMAIAAILALIHDLILTAGIYAIVGFEITPSTVIGMLTILGYSLYDTVVVFDKVHENTRGVLSQQRYTYGESANLAINQTLMRSINTTLIGLLPVGGLLFVGAGLLGVGTLKDLALVLFVGMATGAYSSLFLATPLVVDFKLREKDYKTHTRKVLARRAETGESAESIVAEPDHDADEDDTDKADTTAETVEDEPDDAEDTEERKSRPKALSNASAPRPGARSGDNKRPTGARKKKRR
ncbi:protein translocase subunit SecF [Stackebrandtia nassauensis]|uniref:Protein-export membrane protein SecF n=1 Tax=Stackebrandtia nassauensis (strain DSM 44728 / CIP 108903 / NRRL B-16338 / NBRC 102104 / LLR-40K-21) TaxID=446470 RepID=D3PYP6_STANL|nr:protein translocase subunit SecF [Stackebrandtia nassauensis]ADD43479.1 protein-export membrane protein SecF [Stackebrandtia nassauensis DSM 44728]